jgi:hypothetical protein
MLVSVLSVLSLGFVWDWCWSAAETRFCPSFFGFVWQSCWSAAGTRFCPSFFGFVWQSCWSAAGARFCPSFFGFSPTIYSKLIWNRPQVYNGPQPAHVWTQTKLRFLRTTYELTTTQRAVYYIQRCLLSISSLLWCDFFFYEGWTTKTFHASTEAVPLHAWRFQSHAYEWRTRRLTLETGHTIYCFF